MGKQNKIVQPVPELWQKTFLSLYLASSSPPASTKEGGRVWESYTRRFTCESHKPKMQLTEGLRLNWEIIECPLHQHLTTTPTGFQCN